MSITPKNWKSFQHYKDRSPAWIKLHKGLMTDFAFNRLPLASRALAPMLWLLASEYEGGEITASQDEIAFRLHVSLSELDEALTPLIDSGFFHASEPLAARKQPAIPEKRREREYREEIEEEAIASATPLDPAVPEREYFLRGREVLGSKSGALIAKLLKAKGMNVALARAALEQASQKQNPTEYVAAICHGGNNGKSISGNRTDSTAGRATAREAQHVASVGDAALQYLRQSKSAGSDGETSRDFGVARIAYANN